MHKKISNIDSKCVHSGIKEYEHGPVVPPIYQTSTFKFESAEDGKQKFRGEKPGYIYTRMSNPTIEAMEDAVADLENGYKALGCSSGMAAIHTAMASMVKAGDHIICSESVYGPTSTLLSYLFTEFGVDVTFVDSSDIECVRNAILPNTKVIYIETPGNPTLAVTNLAEVSKIAKSIEAKLIVDNTFMSPILQRPIEFGADIVVHSMTKFLNGHADVVAGVIIASNESDYKRLRKALNLTGGVIDPFNAFLVHRGIKTLALRMERHTENAQKIAEFLERQELIERVYYPGLKSFPNYDTAQKQMEKPGGMISFIMKDGYEAGTVLMDNVEFCQLAVSLGGVETLIQHPASMTHAGMDKDLREKAGISDGLVRLSVGIENVSDIIEDLDSALKTVSNKN